MLGEQIKDRRKQLHITQQELADTIGKGESTISEWEAGKRSPDVDFLPNIASALKTTVAYLVGCTDDAEIHADSALVYDNNDHFTDSEKQMIHQYRSLDAHSKQIVDSVLRLEFERNRDATTNCPHQDTNNLDFSISHSLTITDTHSESRNTSEIFIENLTKLMQKKRLNHREIAIIAKVSRPTVGAWINQGCLPRSNALENLASFFGVSVSYLLTDHRNDQ